MDLLFDRLVDQVARLLLLGLPFLQALHLLCAAVHQLNEAVLVAHRFHLDQPLPLQVLDELIQLRPLSAVQVHMIHFFDHLLEYFVRAQLLILELLLHQGQKGLLELLAELFDVEVRVLVVHAHHLHVVLRVQVAPKSVLVQALLAAHLAEVLQLRGLAGLRITQLLTFCFPYVSLYINIRFTTR